MLRLSSSFTLFRTQKIPLSNKLKTSLALSSKKNLGLNKYSDTVFLPHTTFDQRANSVIREPEIQKWWTDHGIYEGVVASNSGPKFILHDGPPYANGNLHIGHSLNKILKDFIVRYQLLRGRKVWYVPGWDCHGLPIELKVLQTLKKADRDILSSISLRKKAASFANETINSQRESFKRYGVWGDWTHPYTTMQSEYEAAQINTFGKMVDKGVIYRGKKPVYWSPSSMSALAEAELEYSEQHVSQSVFVAFAVTTPSPSLFALLHKIKPQLALTNVSSDVKAVVWTTTPWTIPANLAVAVHADVDYCLASHPTVQHGALLVVAKDLIASLNEKFGLIDSDGDQGLLVHGIIAGRDLAGSKYAHPLADRTSDIVIGGDYINTLSGTGLVHTAPGHGLDDYATGMKHGLPLLSPVDDAGKFTIEAGAEFVGLDVLGDGNTAVISSLKARGVLIKELLYTHKYPYDWRTKKPTIVRATEQWFASLTGFQPEVVAAIDSVQWIPPGGKSRMTNMVQSRGDWCISRQRAWGVPIPVFYNKITKAPLMTNETIEFIEKVIKQHGSDAWWEMEVCNLLPPGPLRLCADDLEKGTDTMDVWFDSGTSWAGVLKTRESLSFPADVYLEGSDQHRGWFQSSLLTAVSAEGCAPYKTVLTHGFVLDEKGHKMSKSLGNVVDPLSIIEGGKNQKLNPAFGADTLRLWVSSVDFSGDVCIGDNIMKLMSESYRKFRNTIRFLVGSLSDFNPETHLVSVDDLPSLDQYTLDLLSQIVANVGDSYDSYQFSQAYQKLLHFVTADLSAFYLDIAKDRLYISGQDDHRRRSCQTVLYHVLDRLVVMLAPLTPHLSEDLWQHLPFPTPFASVFQRGWITSQELFPEHRRSQWAFLRQLRNDVNKCMELARRDKLIGASSESEVFLFSPDPLVRNMLESMTSGDSLLPGNSYVDDLRFVFLASQVVVVDTLDSLQIHCPKYHLSNDLGESGVWVGISRVKGNRCERCWYCGETVGLNHGHSDLCLRCVDVITRKK